VDLQASQFAANGSTEEAVIAHLHKSMGEHMLEETLKEVLDRKPAFFELTGIGSAILKGDLGVLHGATVVKSQQTTIADGHPMDIGSQILECGLSIAHWLAMYNPLLLPDLGRNLVKEFQFLQTASEGRSK